MVNVPFAQLVSSSMLKTIVRKYSKDVSSILNLITVLNVINILISLMDHVSIPGAHIAASIFVNSARLDI